MAKKAAPVATDEAAASPAPRKRGPKVDVELTRQRKADIMREAARLFDRVGYHRVNMEMIAEAAGLKKPTLYHYIRSKDQILFAIHEAMIEALRRQLADRIEAGAGPSDLLRGICQDIFEQTHDFPGYVRAFFEHMRELDGEPRAKIRAERNAYMEQVMRIIESGMDKGVFRRADVRLTALSLLGICNFSYQWYRPDRDPGPAEMAAKVWDIFSSGLLTRPASA